MLSLLLLATVVSMSGCDSSEAVDESAGGEMPPASVTTLLIKQQDVALQYEYVGQIAASREVEVRARVTGIVEQRHYEEGGLVDAGDLLFQLEPSTYEVQLAQAEAELASADAELKRAKREQLRMKPLLAKNLVSQNQLDDADSARDLAEAAVKLAQARVKSATINLDYTQVTAPIAGVAGRALKVEGGLAEEGGDSLLTTLAQTDPVYVDFGVAEAVQLDIRRETKEGKIRLPEGGFKVALFSATGEDLNHIGAIDFQDYKIDSRTGNFATRAIVKNSDGLLAPGQFVNVKLQGAVRTDTIVLPQRSVLDDPEGKYVYAIAKDENDQSIALKRHVVVGEWVKNVEGIENGWIIRSGLESGDEVVIDGSARIFFPGMSVSATPHGAEPAQDSSVE